MPLGRSREPFSHPDWIFEIKWDGFRSLAVINDGECLLGVPEWQRVRLFSGSIGVSARELRSVRSAVLDGEIVCLDSAGKSQFRELLFHSGEPRFYSTPSLWIVWISAPSH